MLVTSVMQLFHWMQICSMTLKLIDEFIEKFETGNQIVYGVRTTR